MISGEDPGMGSEHFRVMTSAVVRAMAEPPARRRAAFTEIVERCRSLGWKLLMQKDSRGVVFRAVAVREATAAAMRRAATVEDTSQDLPVIMFVSDSSYSERMLVAVSREEAAHIRSLHQPSETHGAMAMELEMQIEAAAQRIQRN